MKRSEKLMLEIKRKRDEEEAAKVLQEFEADFGGSSTSKTWVKGSTLVPTHSIPSATTPNGSIYQPSPRVESRADHSPYKQSFPADDSYKSDIPDESSSVTFGRKKNISSIMNTLKRERQGTRSSTSSTSRDDSRDTHDTTTTNLYVGNVPQSVNEEILCKLFGQFGAIASCKIMWPKDDHDKKRNCAFISFMTRENAEIAMKNLDGQDLKGNQMRIGWGKPVIIPAHPIYIAEKINTYNNAVPETNTDIKVVIPEDKDTKFLIHRTVERVILYGPKFEAAITKKELNNQKYSFLFKNDDPLHYYYRWKVFSILQGDPTNFWPTARFKMFEDGPYWIPPDIPFEDDVTFGIEASCSSSSSASSDSEMSDGEKKAKKRKLMSKKGANLQQKHRIFLENKVRTLTTEREKISELMLFCLDHAYASQEIVDLLYKSCLIPTTVIFPTKISRLYLINDILYNSSNVNIPNAWKYRSAFEKILPDVFTHLSEICSAIDSRLKAEQMRRAILNILGVWNQWIVFNKGYLDDLEKIFLTRREKKMEKVVLEKKKVVEIIQPVEEEEEDVDGAPLDDDDDEDIDGEAF